MTGPKKTIFTGDPAVAARFTGRASTGGARPPSGGSEMTGCGWALLGVAALIGAAIAITYLIGA